jgi:hypothetical protein
MSTRSAEEYRDDAHIIRILAGQVSGQDARSSLLGMAELCEYFARRAEISNNQNHQIEQRQSAICVDLRLSELLAGAQLGCHQAV